MDDETIQAEQLSTKLLMNASIRWDTQSRSLLAHADYPTTGNDTGNFPSLSELFKDVILKTWWAWGAINSCSRVDVDVD